MSNKKYALLLAAVLISFAALPAFAQGPMGMGMGRGFGFGRGNGIFGTVTAVNGNIVTVNAMMRQTNSTYTIDATNAKITKNNSSATISDIAVGDTIMVQGTINGSNIAATAILDNMMRGQKQEQGQPKNPPVFPFQGNGQPVVAGSVSAISGSTLTITNKSNVTYTVDASNAKIVKGNATSTISSVATGDNVIVQGTVNGTSVAASSVIDQGQTSTPKPRLGFFGAIGNFFRRLFGF